MLKTQSNFYTTLIKKIIEKTLQIKQKEGGRELSYPLFYFIKGGIENVKRAN